MTRGPGRPHAVRRLAVPLLAGASLAAGSLGASSLSVTTATASGEPRGDTVLMQPAAAEGNPLADRPWGVYKGRAEQSWEPYVNASGTRKELLAKIALRPKAKWFGGWIPNGQIGERSGPTSRTHRQATRMRWCR